MIGPAETPGAQPPAAEMSPGKLYLGVLKDGSTLSIFLGSRVVPLRDPGASLILVRGRYVKVVRIPYNDLTDEHRRALMEWLDMHMPAGAAVAKQKIAETGFCAVPWDHFAGIVEGEKKEEAKPE